MRIQGSAGLIAFVVAGVLPAAAFAEATVARVSVIASGSVTVTRAGERAPTVASVNWPLVAGDAVATDSSARAEIQVDGFTDVRLNGAVTMQIVANDARLRRIALRSGVIELAVLRGSAVPVEIATPAFTLRTRYAGDYRIALCSDGTAAVTPRSGQADVVTKNETETVLAGNTLAVRRTGDSVSTQAEPAQARDAFDAFNADRDRTLLAALDDNTHVPASIAGYDDLNAYGKWTNLASYGAVWVPNDQPADWAPYRDGAWSYVGNDGWTWIGNEPWGWIPYHYGRWLYSSGYNWCWYPPPMGFNPSWAPALVGFFGDGTGDFPNFGWVPLA
ncbi:MAG: FecR domain-containing protein, partial [Candidatus Eremiobacteraeota bacterium]|nr:FecR domain-containing protein [Candidatus Eremiobacteraeota bacterium]